MKNLKIFFFLSIRALFYACQPTPTHREGYLVKGEFSGFPDSTMFYLRNLSTDAVFDSSLLVNGKFQMNGEIADGPEKVWLYARVEREFIYTNLLFGNDEVELKGARKDFPFYVKINGPASQEGKNAHNKLVAEYYARRDSLVQVFFKLEPEGQSGEAGSEIWDYIAVIDSTTDQISLDFARTHTDTHEGMIALNYQRENISKDSLRNIFDSYSPEIKASKYGRVIEVFLEKKIAKVGDNFYDFAAYDQHDAEVKFSELRGKYTLLEFTSAFCGPCILASDELRELHTKHSDSLKIVSFSGDAQKKTWLKSLTRDTVTWTSLWDGKGNYSETAIQYDISGYPTFYVIDEEGKIVQKWTGYSEGLIEKRLEGTAI